MKNFKYKNGLQLFLIINMKILLLSILVLWNASSVLCWKVILKRDLQPDLKNTCDLTDNLKPGCRGNGVETEQIGNFGLTQTVITTYPTYYKCYNKTLTEPKCSSSSAEGDPCDSEYCCDNPDVINAITVEQQPDSTLFEFFVPSYLDEFENFDITKFFSFPDNLDRIKCLDVTLETTDPSITNSFNQPLEFSSVVSIETETLPNVEQVVQVRARPQDGQWQFNEVYWKITSKHTNAVLQSVFFSISQKCDPEKDGYLLHEGYGSRDFRGFKAFPINGQQMYLEYEKGFLGCTSNDQNSGSSYTWSIYDKFGLFKPDFQQNETHIVLELINYYKAEEYQQAWSPIMTNDQSGKVFTTTSNQTILLYCNSYSTVYTALPDSSEGFSYTQTHQIQPDVTPYFIFRDPSSSLVIDHPDTNCVIKDRAIYDDTGLITLTDVLFEIEPQNESDGSIRFKYLGDIYSEANIQFRVRVYDYGLQYFNVTGLQLKIHCGELSNNVTSGFYEEMVFEEIPPDLQDLVYEIDQFEQTGEQICQINGYKIIEATIKVYDENDELFQTLTNQESEIAFALGQDTMMFQFGDQSDSKRVYTFKVQGSYNDVVQHTSEEIIVTIKNTFQIEQPQNEIFGNVSGPTIYKFKKDLVLLDPRYQIKNYTIEILTTEILHEDAEFLDQTSTLHSIDFHSSSEEVIISFPFHCDYARVYTFILKVETTGTMAAFSDPISVVSYNQMTLNTSLETPIFLNVDMYSEGLIFDISQYFVINQPGCTLKEMEVTQIFNPVSQQYFSGQDVKNMMKFDAQNKLHLLNTEVQRSDLKIHVAVTYSQDLLYSFNDFYLIDLFILYVYRDTDIRTKIKPLFDTDPESIYIEVETDSQENTFWVPEIIDEDPSSVTLSITGGFDETFMTLGAREIKFDRFSKDNQGNHSLQLRLTDSDGLFNDYNWTVSLDYMVQEDDQQVQFEYFVKIEAETKNESHFEINDWVQHEEEEETDREPIEIRVKDFNENGELTLIYSEQLFPIEHYKQFGVNLISLNQAINQMLPLEYHCLRYEDPDSIKDPDEKIPELIKYQIKAFTNHTLVLKLDFKNPLYVSSYGQKDRVSMTFIANKLFSSVKDKFSLRSNYTMNWVEVPSQMASEQDFLTLQSIGGSSQKSMLLTLIIPFIFMLFMSASMERVWSFYNMLQLSTNLLNYNTLHIPANQQLISKVVKNIAFFSLFSNEFVQFWLEKYIFGKARALQAIIFQQGPLVTGSIFCSVTLIFVQLGLKQVKAFKAIGLKIKNKMMWNSFLRGQIQTYFPTALMTLGTLKTLLSKRRERPQEQVQETERLLEEVNYEWLEVDQSSMDYIMAFQKLALLVFLPFFSYFFLRKNKRLLQDPDFQAKYQSIYSSLKPRQRSVYQHTLYFILRRFLLAFFTVYLNSCLFVNVFFNFFSSLQMIKYLFRSNPFEQKILNTFEKMNEIYYFFLCYAVIVYSNFVSSPEDKYSIGWYFVYSLMVIASINITVVSYDLILDVYFKTKKASYQKKWIAHEAMLEKMAKFIVYDSMKRAPDLIKSKMEVQLYVLHIQCEYSVSEMSNKIKEIHERYIPKETEVAAEISFRDLPKTQTEEYKREDFEFKKWYFKSEMKTVVREPILIVENTPRFEQEQQINENNKSSEISLDEIATVTAMKSLRKDFEDKQLHCVNFVDRLNLEVQYREDQEKIVKDEIVIEQYIQQKKKGVKGIEKGSINRNYVKAKRKK